MTRGRVFGRAVRGVGTAVVVALAVVLWPRALGGATTLVVVRGDSMLPGASDGDLVVARHADRYDPGDVVVFRVPTGRAGRAAHVMHRIVALGADGSVVTKGDNRSTNDGFATTVGDVLGRRRLRVPQGGRALWWLSRWWILAALGGAITTVQLLGPGLRLGPGPASARPGAALRRPTSTGPRPPNYPRAHDDEPEGRTGLGDPVPRRDPEDLEDARAGARDDAGR